MVAINVTQGLLSRELKLARRNDSHNGFLRQLGFTRGEMRSWELLEDREVGLEIGTYEMGIEAVPHMLRSDEILEAARGALLPGERIASCLLEQPKISFELCRELRHIAVREAEVLFLGTQWDDGDSSTVFPSLRYERDRHGWRAKELTVLMLGKIGERLAHEVVLPDLEPAKFYIAVLHKK